MSNLYEKQALENYLNDGITHGKKISYGSLGRNKNEIPQQLVNYERQLIVMSSKPNSVRNNNKTNIFQQPDNYDTVIYEKQYVVMNSKPNSKPNSMRNSNKTNILQELINYEKRPIVMNSTKNENNSKISVTELSDKTKNIILKQKYELLEKLTKEELMYENMLNYLMEPQ